MEVSNAQGISFKIAAEDAEHKIERLNGTIAYLEKHQEPEYTLQISDATVESARSALAMADEYTLNKLCEYLRLDSYELVKNLAKVTNKANTAEMIAYRDGALGRNDALLKTLSASIKSRTFIDRKEGKEKVKNS